MVQMLPAMCACNKGEMRRFPRVPRCRWLGALTAAWQCKKLLTSKGGGPPGSEAPPFCSAPRGFASLRAPAAFRSCMADTMFCQPIQSSMHNPVSCSAARSGLLVRTFLQSTSFPISPRSTYNILPGPSTFRAIAACCLTSSWSGKAPSASASVGWTSAAVRNACCVVIWLGVEISSG